MAKCSYVPLICERDGKPEQFRRKSDGVVQTVALCAEHSGQCNDAWAPVDERDEEIERLRAEVKRVNEHRDRAHMARVRAAEYAQATRWLRKRVLFLERALVAKHTPTVGVECELCGQPVDFGPMPLPVCGRCISERQ